MDNKSLNYLSNIQKIIGLLFGSYVLIFFIYGSNSGTVYILDIFFIPLVIAQLYYFGANKKLKIKSNSFLLIPFSAVLLLGILYTPDQAGAISLSFSFFTLLLLTILTISILDNYNFINLFIFAIGISAVIFSCYIYNFYGFFGIIEAILEGQRIGYEISQPNTIGHYAAIGFIIVYYLTINISQKKYKILFMISMASLFLIILATLSRKALLLAITGVLFMSMSTKKIEVSKIFLGGILFIGLYFFVSSIPFFDPFMDRLNSMLSLFSGEEDLSNQSDLMRKKLVLEGIQLFLEEPLFGHGTGSFRYNVIPIFGTQIASHNNLIEIAVNHGILGLSTYYLPYLYLIILLSKSITNYYNKLGTLLMTLIVTDVFITGMTLITYYNKLSLILYSIGMAYVTLVAQSKNRSYERNKIL